MPLHPPPFQSFKKRQEFPAAFVILPPRRPASTLPQTPGEPSSQPRSGEIFVEHCCLVIRAPEGGHILSPINGLKPLRLIRIYKYSVPNGTNDRFPVLSSSLHEATLKFSPRTYLNFSPRTYSQRLSSKLLTAYSCWRVERSQCLITFAETRRRFFLRYCRPTTRAALRSRPAGEPTHSLWPRRSLCDFSQRVGSYPQ